jgi:hypothetical protein
MTKAERADRNALILELRRTGSKLEQLAIRFGLSPQAVAKIIQGREPARGRPCPVCSGNSRTIRTYPPEPKFTRRLHRCLDPKCRHEWISRQYDDVDKSSQPHM